MDFSSWIHNMDENFEDIGWNLVENQNQMCFEDVGWKIDLDNCWDFEDFGSCWDLDNCWDYDNYWDNQKNFGCSKDYWDPFHLKKD